MIVPHPGCGVWELVRDRYRGKLFFNFSSRMRTSSKLIEPSIHLIDIHRVDVVAIRGMDDEVVEASHSAEGAPHLLWPDAQTDPSTRVWD